MRIVHYTLGIYPNRTGGLNRYATDLMREQAKVHEVYALMPGPWRPWLRSCSISGPKHYNGLLCYHLINASPQPLFFGIKNPHKFLKRSINSESFKRFYKNVKPEVLHVHTLMGLSEEFLLFFREKGVKIIYTSHDYYGICPKVNFVNSEGKLCEGPDPERCSICNEKSPSIYFLRFRNSTMLLKLRDFSRIVFK